MRSAGNSPLPSPVASGTVTPSAIQPNVGGVAAAPIGPAVAVKPEQEDQFGVYEKFVTIIIIQKILFTTSMIMLILNFYGGFKL